MKINGVLIEDTFAEAFPMKATRLLITAANANWAMHAAQALTGFATSVIACGCEAGIERRLKPAETPDGRPGVSVLLFATSTKELTRQLQNRVGQCVLTAPTSACFAGLEEGDALPLGKALRFFGDGHQIAKKIGSKRYWRVPVMDGEFLCEDVTRMTKAIGGGNFLILAETQADALAASELAVAAMRKIPEVIMPFPGGVVRSGSKVGSRYKTLPASTNDRYCPTLKQVVTSALPDSVGAVLEIVIDGLSVEAINEATRVGVAAACSRGRKGGIVAITAGNYGGNLGPFHFKLREIMAPRRRR
ncbi:MAG: formylmethanofuran--tetrahydromethanopterin N-formyltransferase [Gammaproteobacteria bacterium]|nr:formylmethanofuran--tetrahydromethanopterin N-formyltransferase [Gammaproteobacteria bacterium]